MELPSRIITLGTLKYKKADALYPQSGGYSLLMHIVNDEGKWGSGFSGQVSKRWPAPEREYRVWYRSQGEGRNKFQLGNIQIVDVQSDLGVVNMIAQTGIDPNFGTKNKKAIPPIRYDALRSCLEKVCKEAKERGASLHAPRIGSERAGGDWNEIEKIITETLINHGVNVTIYDLPEENK